LIAYLYAALATQAFLSIHRHRFSILYFVDIHRTYFHTLFTPFTLVVIDHYFISHNFISSSYIRFPPNLLYLMIPTDG